MLCTAWMLCPDHLLCADGLLRADRLLRPARLLCAHGRLRSTAAEGRLKDHADMAQPTTDAIWTLLSSDLRRFIRRKVSDDHVAEDLLQETFVRVHQSLGTLQEADHLAAWVYRITRNVIHDHYRKATNVIVALGDTDPADDCDDSLSQHRCPGAGWLDDMIRSLPERYREAVELAEIEGQSQQEVADRLGLSLSGAKSRVQRGRAMLKGILEQCCHFEFDARGNMMDCDPKPDRKVCRDCGD